MRRSPLVVLAALSGCTSVEVQYVEPAPAGQVNTIETQAKDGYQYFVLSKMVLLVAPASDLGVAPTGQQDAASSKPSVTTSSDAPKASAPASKQTASTGTAAQAAAKAASGADTKVPEKAESDTRLARAKIDGVPWAAVVVPTADNSLPLAVRGKSGFWKSTTLTLSRYANSDRPYAVNSTAENLFPKRLEQFTAILSSVAAGVAAVDSAEYPLQPFKLEIPLVSTKKLNLQEGWMYEFKYDEDESLAGTISIQDFMRLTRGNTVGYWPVPACRSATLMLSRNRDKYSFYVTVSSPSHVRLEPLPISGRIDLGDICSSSTNGATSADPTSDVVNNVAAIQKLVKSVSSPASAAAKK